MEHRSNLLLTDQIALPLTVRMYVCILCRKTRDVSTPVHFPKLKILPLEDSFQCSKPIIILNDLNLNRWIFFILLSFIADVGAFFLLKCYMCRKAARTSFLLETRAALISTFQKYDHVPKNVLRRLFCLLCTALCVVTFVFFFFVVTLFTEVLTVMIWNIPTIWWRYVGPALVAERSFIARRLCKILSMDVLSRLWCSNSSSLSLVQTLSMSWKALVTISFIIMNGSINEVPVNMRHVDTETCGRERCTVRSSSTSLSISDPCINGPSTTSLKRRHDDIGNNGRWSCLEKFSLNYRLWKYWSLCSGQLSMLIQNLFSPTCVAVYCAVIYGAY